MKPLIKRILPIALASASSIALFAQATSTAASTRVVEQNEEVPTADPSGNANKPVPTARHKTSHGSTSFVFGDNAFRSGTQLPKSLIVRNENTDSKTMAEIQEDLAVMSRILDKATADYKDERQEAAGIALVMQGGRLARAMYLDGYGVLFMLNVNAPLKPEPAPEETEDKDKEQAAGEWQETKNELFGGKRTLGGNVVGGYGFGYSVPPDPYAPFRKEFARRHYDAAQVKELENSIVDALRNAKNIRHLKSSDWITVVVRGRGGANDPSVATGGGEVRLQQNGSHIWLESGSEPESQSTMVYRVKKSDVDSLTKKDKVEDLRAKVSVVTY